MVNIFECIETSFFWVCELMWNYCKLGLKKAFQATHITFWIRVDSSYSDFNYITALRQFGILLDHVKWYLSLLYSPLYADHCKLFHLQKIQIWKVLVDYVPPFIISCTIIVALKYTMYEINIKQAFFVCRTSRLPACKITDRLYSVPLEHCKLFFNRTALYTVAKLWHLIYKTYVVVTLIAKLFNAV